MSKRGRSPPEDEASEKLENLLRFLVLYKYLLYPTLDRPKGFRVKRIIRRKLANSKRRIQRRLDKKDLRGCSKPMMTAGNIH